MNGIIRFGFLFLVASSMVGCASARLKLSKGQLDVQTKMSETLFIDPPESDDARTFYLQARNTSDKDFDISEKLRQALIAKGYRTVSQVARAHFIIQVNVLQVGQSSQTAADQWFYRGYGSAGGMLQDAAYVGGATEAKSFVGLGLLGDVTSLISDSVVKDVYFSAITDVQIKERLRKGQKADTVSNHANKSGSSGYVFSRVEEKSDWKISQTRILSFANKVNLEFETAAPELKKALVQSVAGVF